ncbi:MAG TPA: FAD-binding protein, partial [Actinoplanes sp.]|nr:FAD-binding protein [Actinoplanes sp.]
MSSDPLEWLAAAGVEWSAAPDVLASRRTDRSGWPPAGLPVAVAFPRDAPQVRRILRLAHDARTPVVPRGAGTGLAGAATADTGTVVLDL